MKIVFKVMGLARLAEPLLADQQCFAQPRSKYHGKLRALTVPSESISTLVNAELSRFACNG